MARCRWTRAGWIMARRAIIQRPERSCFGWPEGLQFPNSYILFGGTDLDPGRGQISAEI